MKVIWDEEFWNRTPVNEETSSRECLSMWSSLFDIVANEKFGSSSFGMVDSSQRFNFEEEVTKLPSWLDNPVVDYNCKGKKSEKKRQLMS